MRCMPEFKKLITRLRKHYDAPTMPPGSVIFAAPEGAGDQLCP